MKYLALTICSLLIAGSGAAQVSESGSYVGIFDATMADTGELSIMIRKVNTSPTGQITIDTSQKLPPLAFLIGFTGSSQLSLPEKANISNLLQKQTKNGKLTIFCNGCTENIPIEISKKYEITNSFELKSDIFQLKQDISNFNKAISASLAEQQRKDREAALLVIAQKKEEELSRKKFLARHEIKCKSFGFKPNTESYAQCRLKLELAERQTERDAAIAESNERGRQFDNKERAEQLKRDQDEKRRYHEAQLAEQKRQRDTAAGIALMQMGSSILNPPKPPPPTNQTIVTPGGIVNCHTTGTVTNCF